VFDYLRVLSDNVPTLIISIISVFRGHKKNYIIIFFFDINFQLYNNPIMLCAMELIMNFNYVTLASKVVV